MKIGLHKAEMPKGPNVKPTTLLGVLAAIIILLGSLVAAGRKKEKH